MRTFRVQTIYGDEVAEGTEFSSGTVVAEFPLRTGVYENLSALDDELTAVGCVIVPDTELADTLALANTLLAALASRFRYLPDPYGRALGYAEKLGKRAGLL